MSTTLVPRLSYHVLAHCRGYSVLRGSARSLICGPQPHVVSRLDPRWTPSIQHSFPVPPSPHVTALTKYSDLYTPKYNLIYSLPHVKLLRASQTTLKVSHLTFWGRREDVYLPMTDVMTLGDTGDSVGETILRLKRYSSSETLYFSSRLGRVVDRQAFEKVFGTLI
uniref:Transmembrane protein 186 n=1 Tax=Hucho hucho TaxID=62062 RepID=A0A4W5K481_9TELE